MQTPTLRCLLLLFGLLLSVRSTSSAQTLQNALSSKDTNRIAQLIREGANPNEVDRYGGTYLMTATRWNDLPMMRFWLGHGARVDSPRSAKGRTALMVGAAYYADSISMRYLLDRGADPNAQAGDSTTALMLAAQNWKADIVALLMAYGADRGRKDQRGKTALDHLEGSLVADEVKQVLKEFRVDRERCRQLLGK